MLSQVVCFINALGLFLLAHKLVWVWVEIKVGKLKRWDMKRSKSTITNLELPKSLNATVFYQKQAAWIVFKMQCAQSEFILYSKISPRAVFGFFIFYFAVFIGFFFSIFCFPFSGVPEQFSVFHFLFFSVGFFRKMENFEC